MCRPAVWPREFASNAESGESGEGGEIGAACLARSERTWSTEYVLERAGTASQALLVA